MCTTKDLIEIAKKLDKWEPTISKELSNPEAIEIKNDNQRDYLEQKTQALLKWKKKNGCSATFNALAVILKNDGNVDLADEVKEMALQGKIRYIHMTHTVCHVQNGSTRQLSSYRKC